MDTVTSGNLSISPVASHDTTDLTAYVASDSLRIVTAPYREVVPPIFGFLTVFGLMANCAMNVILLRMKPTFFTVILIGLSTSDAISALNSPLYVYRQLYWRDFKLPPVFCFTPIAGDITTSAVTVQLVFLLSLLRFRIITKRSDAKSESILRNSRLFVMVSYIVTSALVASYSAASIEVLDVRGRFVCKFKNRVDLFGVVVLILITTVGSILPIILTLLLCLAIIAFQVYRAMSSRAITQSAASKRKEKKALVQLATIIATFLAGYSADYGAKVFFISNEFQFPDGVDDLIVLMTHGVLRITECVNPFMYYLASSDIQEEARSFRKAASKIIPFGFQRNNRISPTLDA